jgi:diadenosine tetraphosphate (Ap4A) HIT family hydrolase
VAAGAESLDCRDCEVMMECWTCRSVAGEKRISPGPTIYDGTYWMVEHAYPVKVKGWIVIVLKRHAEALHHLQKEEFGELSEILSRIVPILHEVMQCEKEYISCYAEKAHFHHIHFHVLAKPADLPEEFQGARSFAFININEEEAVSPQEITELCELLRRRMSET